eukprot:7109903-Prymnesium_polylepis.2
MHPQQPCQLEPVHEHREAEQLTPGERCNRVMRTNMRHHVRECVSEIICQSLRAHIEDKRAESEDHGNQIERIVEIVKILLDPDEPDEAYMAEDGTYRP